MSIYRPFQLNIRLDVRGRRNSLHDCTDRALHTVNVLREFDPKLKAQREITENEDGPEITLDDLLVVKMQVSSVNAFYMRLRTLAVELEQEAIAVYSNTRPGQPAGELIGPNVLAWGDFRVERFKFFDDARCDLATA